VRGWLGDRVAERGQVFVSPNAAAGVRAAPDIGELKALTPDVVIPMHCTGRAFIAKMRTEMPEQLVDWNTGSRFTFGV